MMTYVARRVAQAIPVLFAVSLVVFVMVRLIPGDPAQIMVGDRATPEQVAQMQEKLGLDRPLPLQYGEFFRGALTGDLGESIVTGQAVTTEIWERLPATMELAIAALLVGLVVGLPLGVLAAMKRGSVFDRVASTVAVAGLSTPIFWLAMLLIVIFGVKLGMFPFPGRIDSDFDVPRVTGLLLVDTLIAGDPEAWWSAFRHLVMPAIALGTIPAAMIMRMARSSMLDVLGEDYLRTARAKGVSPRALVLRHALPNAMLPTITVIGLQAGLLMGGAVITETIFSWPGIGQVAYQSITRRDYALIQGIVLYGAAFFVLVNLVVDVLYSVLDPRVRY